MPCYNSNSWRELCPAVTRWRMEAMERRARRMDMGIMGAWDLKQQCSRVTFFEIFFPPNNFGRSRVAFK